MQTIFSKSKTKSALILDPEFKAREILRRFLDVLPEVQVKGCFDRSYKVVKYARDIEPDVIFIALELIKDMDETEWVVELSKHTKIIVTAYYFDPLLEQLEEYTAGYLFKPIDLEELKDKLRE